MQSEAEAVLQLDLRPLDVGHGGEGLEHRVLGDHVQDRDEGTDTDDLKEQSGARLYSLVSHVGYSDSEFDLT